MITTDKRPNPNQERDADIARKLVANCERLHVPHELTAEQLAGREPVTATDIMWVCVEGNVDAGEVVRGIVPERS